MRTSDVTVRVAGPPDRERTLAWDRLCRASGLSDGAWLPEDIDRFDGRVRHRRFDDLVLVEMTAGPFGLRYAQDSAAAQYIGLSVNNLVYTERVRYRDDGEHVQTQAINVWDTARLLESEITTPMAQTVVLVPKAALGGGASRLPPARERVPWEANPATRVLRDLLLGVVGQADRLPPAAVGAARNAIVELLPSVLGAGTPGAGTGAAVSEGMRIAVCRWVDERLSLGAVSPAEAAEHHGISVRSLHRLFDGTGRTFGAFVRARRLELARRDLAATTDMVQTIAVRWGYADASHFISEFRGVHGVTPAASRRREHPG